MPEVRLYIATNYKSPAQRKGKTKYILEFILPSGEPVTREEFIEHGGTLQEAVLDTILIALKRLKKRVNITIFLNKCAVLNAWQNGWVEMWRWNDYKSKKGTTIKDAEKYKQIVDNIVENGHQMRMEEGLGEYELYLKSEMEEK